MYKDVLAWHSKPFEIGTSALSSICSHPIPFRQFCIRPPSSARDPHSVSSAVFFLPAPNFSVSFTAWLRSFSIHTCNRAKQKINKATLNSHCREITYSIKCAAHWYQVVSDSAAASTTIHPYCFPFWVEPYSWNTSSPFSPPFQSMAATVLPLPMDLSILSILRVCTAYWFPFAYFTLSVLKFHLCCEGSEFIVSTQNHASILASTTPCLPFICPWVLGLLPHFSCCK